MKHFYIILALVLGFFAPANAQEQSRRDSINQAAMAEDFITVSLLYATPGEVIYSLQGHAFLRLQSPSNDLDITYTFETEETPENIFKFFRGDAMGGFVYAPTEVVLEEYRKQGRGIWEQKLNLTPRQEQKLWRSLDQQMANHEMLKYDFLKTNCSTQIIYAVEAAIYPDTITYHNLPHTLSGEYGAFRRGVRDITRDYPWGQLFWNLTLGVYADTDTDLHRLLVPRFLFDAWKHAEVNGRPLSNDLPNLLVRKTLTPKHKLFTPNVCVIILQILVFISLINYFRRRTYTFYDKLLDILLFSIHTAITVWLTYLSPLFGMISTDWNLMLILYNPFALPLWFLFRNFKQKKVYVQYLFAICTFLFLIASPWIPQVHLQPALGGLTLCYFVRSLIKIKLARQLPKRNRF